MKLRKEIYLLLLGTLLLGGCSSTNSSGGQSNAATYFMVTAQSAAIAGSPFNVTVNALDTSNGLATSYSGTVHFTSTDSRAILPPNTALANGTVTVQVTLNGVGSQTITATDTTTMSLTGSSPKIGVANAPVPLVNQPLSPDAVLPGGAGFQLTANGTGFVPGSTLMWNGSPRVTTFVSNSKLTAAILASDIAVPNTTSITVVNPGPGATSNVVFFEAALPTPTMEFSNSPLTINGAYSVALATGDFNRDGKLDVVVVNQQSYNISVLLGNGDGTFQAPVNYAVGSNPMAVAVGDFNGDGNLDLAVANAGAISISILLGNGDGTFQTPVNYGVFCCPYGLAVGDFNGDGNLDLAVADRDSNNVSILLGNGDGTFQSSTTFAAGTYPVSVVVGDFNGDGKLDVVAVNNSSNNISVLLGKGDGTFQPAVNYDVGNGPSTIVAADFNGDGKLDLAIGGGTNQILLGNGDGTFQPPVSYNAAGSGVMVGDFNGDGKLDLAVAGTSTEIVFGNGDGTFQPPVDYAPGGSDLTGGDFNGQGRLDLIVANAGGLPPVSELTQSTLAPSTASLSFPLQLLQTTSGEQTVTLTNVSAEPMSISGIVLEGTNAADFTQTQTCGSILAPGAACTVTITFTPSQLGPRSASLTITDDAPGGPQSVALSGTGVVSGPNATLSTTSLSLNCYESCGPIECSCVCTVWPAQPILSDFGNADLSISLITTTAAFQQKNTCTTNLAAGNSCTTTISLGMYAKEGGYTGTLTITDDAPGSPQVVQLSAESSCPRYP